MIMKPKAKKFCFKKLLVFGLIMVVLQVLTFAGEVRCGRPRRTYARYGTDRCPQRPAHGPSWHHGAH